MLGALNDLELQLPKVSFFSHALTMHRTWPEIFAFESKPLPYQHYNQIAVCSLPREAAGQCRHKAVLAVDAWADHVPVPFFGLRTGCGMIGADVRPNWAERQERPSLTGWQWH